MTQSPFPAAGPNKPFPGKPQKPIGTSSSGGGAGRACGCVVVGCGGVLFLMIALCGIGYYVFSYTSTPLKWVERGLEQDGNVRIEGLNGSISSGFEVETLEVKSELRVEPSENSETQTAGPLDPALDENPLDEAKPAAPASAEPTELWNRFEKIKFKYSGFGMFGGDKLVIDEISVGSGRIYSRNSLVSGDESGSPLDFAVNINEEFFREFDKAKINVNADTGGDLEVKKVSLQNLTFIDQTTKTEFKIEEVLFEGLKFERGKLSDIGNLTIRTDNLDLDTSSSVIFPATTRARHYQGQIKPGLNPGFRKEIPFHLDVMVSDNGQVLYQGACFDDQVTIDLRDHQKPATWTFKNFDSEAFLRSRQPEVIPQQINLQFTFDTKAAQNPLSVEPGGSFRLGETTFNDVQLSVGTNNANNTLQSSKVVGDQTVNVKLHIVSPVPFLQADLSIAGRDSLTVDELRDLWGQVAFGKKFSELDEEQASQVSIASQKQIDRNSKPVVREQTDVNSNDLLDPTQPARPSSNQ